MDYLLKASAVLIIFYVCYQLLLQRDTFFQANRWFLLCGLIFACCIPFVVIPIYIEYTAIETSGFISTTNTNSSTPNTIQDQPFDYLALAMRIYIAGVLIFFGKLAVELLSLRNILKRSTLKSEGDFKLLETTETIAPFSFFNRIVYNPDQFKGTELTHVINHEKVHTNEWHSIDTLIAQLSCIFFWFNPVAWFYKKAVQQNLEFIADQKAQYISECEKSYQTVLLKASVQNHQYAFTNQFNTSLIKKRIVMLHKSKSNKFNKLKFILILPILALFIMSFNTKNVYIEIPIEDTFTQETQVESIAGFAIPSNQTGDVEIIITKNTTDAELEIIKQTLADKGITFTYKNIKRNSKGEITSIKTDFKNADHSSNYNINGDNGIKAFRFKSNGDAFAIGTVDSSKNTYVFETDDGATKVQSTGSNVYVFESNEDEDDNNSNTTTSKNNNSKTITYSSKTWTNKDGEKITIDTSENGKNNIFISESDEPLFVVDGKIVKKSLFEDIDSDDIKSVNILKGKSALEAYGDKGKNGVVLLSKKGSKSIFMNSKKKNGTVISSNNFSFSNDGKQPLIIVDGKIIETGKLNSVSPDMIDNIEVVKGDKAIKIYGKKAKDGAIIVNMKKAKNVQVIRGNKKPIIVEVNEETPYQIQTAVSTAYYFDDKNSTAEFIISKTASNAFLDKQKRDLKAHGINAKFTKVRRNKAGEITSIKISLDDNKGRKSSASWKEKDQAIPDIVMGKSNNDKLFVRAIGN